jgi:hypothetical protein
MTESMVNDQVVQRVPNQPGTALYLHDAFISYSRKDLVFATMLEKALESHSIPRELNAPKQRLDVFRDEDDFTGTDYYHAINKHLAASRTLIVICSPASRASRYVNEEIRSFVKANHTEQIIPILLSGIPNNEASLDQETEMAFPDALVESLAMPLAISYRGFNIVNDKINKSPFDSSWHSLLANILGVTRSEIERREAKRRNRLRSYWLGGIALTGCVLLLLAFWAQQERQATEARGRVVIEASVIFSRSQLLSLCRESDRLKTREEALATATAAGFDDLAPKLRSQANDIRANVAFYTSEYMRTLSQLAAFEPKLVDQAIDANLQVHQEDAWTLLTVRADHAAVLAHRAPRSAAELVSTCRG